MFEAERVVFLVMVGLSLVGLDFGAMLSGASGLDGAGFVPRPRVRPGVSSCSELRRCDARVSEFLGAGIGTMQWSKTTNGPGVEFDVWLSRQWSPCKVLGRRSARQAFRVTRKLQETEDEQNLRHCKETRKQSLSVDRR